MTDRCESILERLGAYLDGELEPEEARAVEDHLRSCPHCRRVKEELAEADRILREGVTAEPHDPEREERAAARLIDRLREEPEPAWAGRGARTPAARREPANGQPWIRSLFRGRAVPWIGGLAAATAAVLLAIRLGMPTRPIERPAAPEREAAQVPAREPAQSREASQAAGTTEPTPASSSLESPPGIAPAPSAPSQAPENWGGVQGPTDKGANVIEEPPTVTKEEDRSLHLRGGRADETSYTIEEARKSASEGEAGKMAEAPPAEEGREKERSDTQGKDEAKHDEALSVRVQELRDSRTTWGKIKPAYDETTAEKGQDVYRAEAADSLAAGLFSPGDTLGSATDLAIRLETGMRALAALPDAQVDRTERARRWRTIGDLWEWLARSEGQPAYAIRAVRAYEVAVSLDPAAPPDSVRLARARAASR